MLIPFVAHLLLFVNTYIIQGITKDLKTCENGAFVLFNFADCEVISFEIQEDVIDDEWEILPQQSPCSVCKTNLHMSMYVYIK